MICCVTCPLCSADPRLEEPAELTVECDGEAIHSIDGCAHASAWKDNGLDAFDKQTLEDAIWEFYDDWVVTRAEEARERRWEERYDD